MVEKPQPTFAFGPDYPKTLTDLIDGVEMPLVQERPWSRIFRHPTSGAIFQIPRTMDGSASLTLEELTLRWAGWTPAERRDFCLAVAWLRGRGDFADIVRFLMREGGSDTWSAIALSVAHALPQDEAYRVLVQALEATPLSASANLMQGIKATGHPSAASTIRERLDRLRATPELWEDAPQVNHLAMTAMWATKNLLELGEDPNSLADFVRALAAHRCGEVGRFSRMHLKAAYPWLAGPPSASTV